MSTLVSLTRPISTDSAAGTLLPWERPYTTEPIATLTHNGANLFHIDMSPAAATRIITGRIADEDATAVRDIDPTRLLNRLAAVIRVAEGRGEITENELAASLDGARLHAGGALLLVTGFTGAASAAAGEGRYLSREAAARLAQIVRGSGVDLVLTDLPYLTAPGGIHVAADWLTAPAWQRPAWPSPNAAAYLAYHYGREKALDDWAPTLDLVTNALLVLGLTGADQLTASEVIVNVAPFQVQDVGEAPCTVVAQPTES